MGVKYCIKVILLFSFANIIAMNPQQSESSRRIAQAMQAASHYDSASSIPRLNRTPLRQESDNTPPENPAIRKFKIEDYKAIKILFNQAILNDSFENCPSTLKKPLSDLVEFSSSDNPLIKNNLPNRFIFVGPSGCGKTLLAYAIGYKTKRPYTFVKSAELSNSFKGSCPDIANGLFKPMIDSQQPGLIILDEFMAFIKKYDNRNDSDSGAVEHLWQILDEAKTANPRLLVICTANDISNLPAMFLTRFGGTQHKFEQPSDERKEKLIKQILPTSEQTENEIKSIVKQLKNISLREISDILDNAQFEAAIRAERTKTPMNITTLDILKTLQPVLREYSERTWAHRKEKAWEVTKTAAPYVISISLAAAGLYLTWCLHNKQAAQAEKNHSDALTKQKIMQEEAQAFTKTMQEAANKHANDLYQKQYNDTHGVGPTLKQAGTQIATSAAAAGASYIVVKGLEKHGDQILSIIKFILSL